jgi:DNA-binding GntR family transcriptional regulator
MASIRMEVPARASADAPVAVTPRKGELHGSTVVRLRELVITGELAPGERLNERELCERLQVSRTPVREAIKTLIQEGLLRAQPNRAPAWASTTSPRPASCR